MSDLVLLSLVWMVPLIGSGLVFLLPNSAHGALRLTALATTIATLLVCGIVAASYLTIEVSGAPLRTVDLGERIASSVDGDLAVRHVWIPQLDVDYGLGVDGLSLGLLLLTSTLAVLACLASWGIAERTQLYFGLFLILESACLGVFLATDLVLFYLFFEFMLLPMYFLIALWGGPERDHAALKFLLYTLFGSVFLLLAILGLYFGDGASTAPRTFQIGELAAIAQAPGGFDLRFQYTIALLFLVGFVIKLPAVPFHTWLPDAHVQAPTPISMMLAGVLLKVGGYGLIRLAWPLAPLGLAELAWLPIGLGTLSIVYGALTALGQSHYKSLVAYSSISHMGYVLLGLGLAASNAEVRPAALAGAYAMLLAHGITSAGLFFCVGSAEKRTGTLTLDHMGGLVARMPFGTGVASLLLFATLGLPGLCVFVAEALVILAAIRAQLLCGILAALSIVITAGTMLWTLQRAYLGSTPRTTTPEPSASPENDPSSVNSDLPHDLDLRERLIAIPLVILAVALGVLPQLLIFDWVGPTLSQLVSDR